MPSSNDRAYLYAGTFTDGHIISTGVTTSGSYDSGTGPVWPAHEINYTSRHHSQDFRSYIDEDHPCPNRRKIDDLTIRIAQRIYNVVLASVGPDVDRHKDMIFERAQEIARMVGI